MCSKKEYKEDLLITNIAATFNLAWNRLEKQVKQSKRHRFDRWSGYGLKFNQAGTIELENKSQKQSPNGRRKLTFPH